MDDRLIYEVLEVVGEIPSGKVATYGQIASLIGRPKNARLVGKILSQVEIYGDYPCHRVVNASAVAYTQQTLPPKLAPGRSRWSADH